MADSVLLDTNGWLALLNSGDSTHAAADHVWRDLIGRGSRILLTDWIVAETGNGSARSRARHRVSEAVQATINDPRVELVIVDEELLFAHWSSLGSTRTKRGVLLIAPVSS